MNTTTVNQSAAYASEAARIEAINQLIGARRLESSALARCIAPLLVACDWMGSPRSLLDRLPAEDRAIGVDELADALAAIGFRVQRQDWKLWQTKGSLDVLPVGSILLTGETPHIYLGRSQGSDWWHDGKQALAGQSPTADTLLLIDADPEYKSLDGPQVGWLNRLLFSARREIGGVLVLSLIANLLALVISLFTMFVYNTVIPSGATGTLWTMSAGAIIAILGAWGLRLARVGVVSRLTAWAGARISDIAVRKTLGLPADVSARLGVENNLIRLRTIESVRQWFGGGGGAVNADYPFIVVFLIVIALLGGWVVIVPLLGLLLFAAISWPLSTVLNARSNEVGRVSRHMGEMTSVVTTRLRALRGVRGSGLWNKRLAELVAQSVSINRNYALANGLVQTIGQALGMLIVLGTMGAGIALVLAGDMSTGGLIAAMMLIWRVTTPAQQLFASQVRIKQLGDSTRQFERLLASIGEVTNPQLTSPVARLTASIEADRLYYRYSADREPALGGVSFKVEAGQILAVVGPNGAGKTTLLETLAGLRATQNGRVLVGGRDIRQFDPTDYRTWLGYLPQHMPGLPVSLREALGLCRPASTDAAMAAALERVAGAGWWRFFGAGSAAEALDISILPWREDRDATRGRFIVRLAGAILGDPPLILLDDPLSDRDPALDPHLQRLLDDLRGKTTVILSTHRSDLIQRADLIAVLNDGALAHFGPVAAPQAAPTAPVQA